MPSAPRRAAPRPPDPPETRSSSAPCARTSLRHDMASASQLFFIVGVIAVALAFAAHVGHAVLLANGRRALPRFVASPQPAFAGVVTGSFVERAATRPSAAGEPASPVSRSARFLGLVAVGLLGAALVARGIAVGRGPWGNMLSL